jgi:hypothetical protein
VSEHAFPSSAKSAERIEGAIMAAGAILEAESKLCSDSKCGYCRIASVEVSRPSME